MINNAVIQLTVFNLTIKINIDWINLEIYSDTVWLIFLSGEKPFKCDQCDFACIQSFDLVKHKFTHSGDKPYKCDLCPKQFTRPARLRDHIRTHTGEKPYVCDVCGKGFAIQTGLKSHQASGIMNFYGRIAHSRKDVFVCSLALFYCLDFWVSTELNIGCDIAERLWKWLLLGTETS